MVELKISGTLHRPLRDRLGDVAYQSIKGSTDSEHFFALLIDELQANPAYARKLCKLHCTVDELAKSHQVASANMLVSDGHRLVALVLPPAPSLLAGTIQPSRGGYCFRTFV